MRVEILTDRIVNLLIFQTEFTLGKNSLTSTLPFCDNLHPRIRRNITKVSRTLSLFNFRSLLAKKEQSSEELPKLAKSHTDK